MVNTGSWAGLRVWPNPTGSSTEAETTSRTGPYPIVNSYNQRSFGVGVRQRGAAVCIQVTTEPYYAKPSNDQIPV